MPQHLVRVIRLTLFAAAASSAFAQAPLTPGRLTSQVTFEQPSPFTRNSVLISRLLTPRQRERELSALAARAQTLAAYPLDLGAERFSVYVPKQQPAAGYGLLVFIPPWEDARLPLGWSSVLDRTGLIFVTAERSGNSESIPGRRIPLALTAAYALMSRFPVDPNRAFIGGFSGGSRVALRLALAFPDVFAGAVLNSGSDPVGSSYDPLPSADLMVLLQTRTRFVFITGERDEVNLSQDAHARASLSTWCINRTRAILLSHVGHDVMDGNALAEALGALERAYPEDPARDRCQASMRARVQHAQAETAALQAQPQSSRAQRQLDRIDQEFGGLLEESATPASTPSD
jgi:pimeloyl-ACP methyl ester carboxylesterase